MLLVSVSQTPWAHLSLDDGNRATKHAGINGAKDHHHCHTSGHHKQGVPYLQNVHGSGSYVLSPT